MTNDFQTKLMAGLAAVAVTLTLFVSSFSTPEAGVIASLLA